MNFKYKNFKKITLILTKGCFAMALLIFVACDTDETQEVAQLTNLVWQDEFSVEGTPNPMKWGYDIGDGTDQGLPAGWGNNELQYYTDRPENVRVENGVMILTAREESFMGSNYTSARITTQGLMERKYGRFEARIRLPAGKGIWPAFWLLGNDCDENVWPQCGEIDIMEYLGNKPTVVLGSVHGPGYNAGDSIGKEYRLSNDRFDEGFHIFGIEWGPNYINYYVDGDLYQTITPETTADEAITFNAPANSGEWVFNDRPFYIIINMAVGGSLPGAPNAETEFPQSMYVDYVRVYN